MITSRKNKYTSQGQFGFRQHRGTSTANTQSYEQIANVMTERKQCNLVLRDVSKAIDKVWHTEMRLKIVRLGLPDYLSRLLCNFITNRKAKIKVKEYYGDEFVLESGVPQGSCLSSTLYTLYTADLPPPAPNSDYVIYADDISQVVVYPGRSKQMMTRVTERAIDTICKYENT